jgi:hypothetical protein
MNLRNPRCESAVRATAKRNGLVLRRARIRNKNTPGYGTCGVFNLATQKVVFGSAEMGGYGKTFEECANYVRELDRSYRQPELLMRGWNRTMITRWLGAPDETKIGSGGYEEYFFRATRVENAENQESWKRERDRWVQICDKATTPYQWYYKRELKTRGWTDRMIDSYLGEPDERRDRTGGGEFHFYYAERVAAWESNPAWQAERDKWAARSAKAAESLKRNAPIREAKRAQEQAERRRLAEEAGRAARRLAEEAERAALAQVGILPALSALNHEAKRLRNRSRGAWANNDRERAWELAEEKRLLYYLKGQALEWLLREGKLRVVGFHAFKVEDGRAIVGTQYAEVLEGEGYRFHRPAPAPENGADTVELLDEIKAKPPAQDGVPPDTAIQAVKGYLQERTVVAVYEWEPRRNAVEDYEDDRDRDNW